jgi:hypothetical protein
VRVDGCEGEWVDGCEGMRVDGSVLNFELNGCLALTNEAVRSGLQAFLNQGLAMASIDRVLGLG